MGWSIGFDWDGYAGTLGAFWGNWIWIWGLGKGVYMLCIGFGFPGYMGWKMVYSVSFLSDTFNYLFTKAGSSRISTCDCLSRLMTRHLRSLWQPTVTFPSSSPDIPDRNNGARRVNPKR